MNVTYAPVTVRELKEGYQDFGDAGVVALQGRLDARPPYQREFVYSEAQEVEVIVTAEANGEGRRVSAAASGAQATAPATRASMCRRREPSG